MPRVQRLLRARVPSKRMVGDVVNNECAGAVFFATASEHEKGGGHEALDSPRKKKTIITNDVLTLGALGSGWNVYVIYRARPRKEMRSQ